MTGLPDPVLLVGGAPRSGTTLLRNMLACHPRLAVPDESYWIRTVHHELVRRGRPDDPELGWRLVRDERFFKQWRLTPERVQRVLAEHPPTCYADVVRAAFHAYADSCGKPFSADKTPSHAHCFAWHAAQFPTSRFVHLVRDPREVCMSLSVQPWHRGGLAEAAREWTSSVRDARKAAAGLGDRFLELRYEDLVRRPGAELERICRFAGIPFSDAMLRYPASGTLLLDPHHAMSSQAPRHGVRRWADELERADVALVELIAGPVLEAAGYRRAIARPPLRARVARRRHRLWRTARRRFDGRLAAQAAGSAP